MSPSIDEASANTNTCSYFVTELLGTDLHRLLTSRPLEKQFIQYFLYQILVCEESHHGACAMPLTVFSAD